MRQRLLIQFGGELRDLRTRSGKPSYSDLARIDPTLKRSTMSDVLSGKSAPSVDFVRDFVHACALFARERGHPLDMQDADVGYWRGRWLEFNKAVELAPRAPKAVERRSRPRTATNIPHQLRPANRVFVGRTTELDQLGAFGRSSLPGAPLVVIVDGMAGCGKTALAVRWAHDATEEFGDGQLYADLGGFSPSGPADPAVILDGFVHALGGTDARTDDVQRLSAQFRSLMAGRRTLVILDDARDAAQVQPLLPASADAYVIVTSRAKLPDLAIDVGAYTISLAPLNADDGFALLNRLITDRVTAEPAAAHQLVALCGGLPLALRLASQALAAHLSIEELCNQLRSLEERIAILDSSLGPGAARLRAVLQRSCELLPEQPRQLLQMLVAHPGNELSVEAAAALAGRELEPTLADLQELERVNLLDRAGDHRYRVHELIRAYVESDGQHSDPQVHARLFSWYLHTAASAAQMMLPQRGRVRVPDLEPEVRPAKFDSLDDANAWFARELPNLMAITRAASDLGEHPIATSIPNVTLSYLNLRKPWNAWLSLFEIAARSAQASGDALALAGALNALGIAFKELRRYPDAEDHLRRAAAAYMTAGENVGASMALNNVGTLLNDQRQFDDGIDALRHALGLLEDSADPWRRSIVLNNLANAHALRGHASVALDFGERALSLCRELDDAAGEGCALTAIGEARFHQGDLIGAAESFRSAIVRSRVAMDDYNRARTERRLAEVLTRVGELDEAQTMADSALKVFDELSDPAADEVRTLMEQIDKLRGRAH